MKTLYILGIIIYISFIIPNLLHSKNKLTKSVIGIYDKPIFGLIILCIIYYVIGYDRKIGMFLLLSILISIDTIQKFLIIKKLKRKVIKNNINRELNFKIKKPEKLKKLKKLSSIRLPPIKLLTYPQVINYNLL